MIADIIKIALLGALEVILGIDNVLMLNLLSMRVRPERRKVARRLGVITGMTLRVILIFLIGKIMALKEAGLSILGYGFTWHGLIMLGGGIFLIFKATVEIYHHSVDIEDVEELEHTSPAFFGDVDNTDNTQNEPGALETVRQTSLAVFWLQALGMSTVFSLDSVFTAIGMGNKLWIMVAGILVGALAMGFFVNIVGDILEKYPSLKTLALAFVFAVGAVLTIEGFHPELAEQNISHYLYVAMTFSLMVESINIYREWRKKRHRTARRHSYTRRIARTYLGYMPHYYDDGTPNILESAQINTISARPE